MAEHFDELCLNRAKARNVGEILDVHAARKTTGSSAVWPLMENFMKAGQLDPAPPNRWVSRRNTVISAFLMRSRAGR